MERRKIDNKATLQKSTPLPVDFLTMAKEVYLQTFGPGLKRLEALRPGAVHLDLSGEIFPDEILLTLGITQEGHIAATTVYASCDFDPKASSPKAQDLLNACVDGIASILDHFFDEKHPERLESIADRSLAALDDIPFEWTPFTIAKRKVFLRMDKANPALERATDAWLAQNDPDYHARLEREKAETEKLFVTGAKRETDVSEDLDDADELGDSDDSDDSDDDSTLH